MTGKKEYLRDFIKLDNTGVVKLRNNNKFSIKGYGKITNGIYMIKQVTYVKRLQHNLISVSQLVVGIGNQVTFDEEGSVISNKNSKEVLLKSKRKWEMFTLDLKPIILLPSTCLLSKAFSDLS